MNSITMNNFIKRKVAVNLAVALPIIISQIIVVNPSMAESTLSKSALLESKGLFPVFNPNQVDYAIRDCAKRNISISFKSGKDVVVNSKRVKNRWSGKTVEDQILEIILDSKSNKKYYIRCLPDDFPNIKFTGKKTSGYYTIPYESGKVRYFIITDGSGAPIWYSRSGSMPANILALNGSIITQSSKKEALRGASDNVISITAMNGETNKIETDKNINIDAHHIGVTQNGGLLTLGAEYREVTDLNGVILGANALTGECPISPINPKAIGSEVYEYDKNGALIWQWRGLDHIAKNEGAVAPYLLEPEAKSKDGCAADVHHINWAERSNSDDTLLVSLYTTGAVYNIDRASGEILWKIGGVKTSKSLTIIDDPMSQPLGVHGGQLLDNGWLLLFDNRRLANEPGRGIIYKIDTTNGTATFIKSFIPPSNPCTATSGTVYCPSWAMGGISAANPNQVLVSWGDKFENSNVATVFSIDGGVITNITDPTLRARIYRVQWEPEQAWNRDKLRFIAGSKRAID